MHFMIRMFFFIGLFFYTNVSFVVASLSINDSLRNLLQGNLHDTSKVQVLKSLFSESVSTSIEDAQKYAGLSMDISVRNNYPEGLAISHHQLGYINYLQSNYDLALEHWLKTMNIRKTLGDKKALSTATGNVGIIYKALGDVIIAISYYLEAMKIDEEIGNKSGVARHLSNIGVIYWSQNDYKALEYYEKALKVYEELGEEKGVALCLGNIALFKTNNGNYHEALDIYNKALAIDGKLGLRHNVARHYGNIGLTYEKLKNYDEAMKYYQMGLKINEELGSKGSVANDLGNIGNIYFQKGNNPQAIKYLTKALQLSIGIQSLKLQKDQNRSLFELYEKTGDLSKALTHYKLYIQIKDSLINERNTEELVTRQMEYNFSKKQMQDSIEFAKKQEIKDFEIKEQKAVLEKEKILNYSLYGGIGLVMLFSLGIYNRLKITRKQKSIIEDQKQKVELQKEIIEEKNKDITDSINYAKNIQQAILPVEERIAKAIADYFILFKPKDIVSGDFYWFLEKEEKVFLSVVDCTGHGVPGAFMSMIGSSILNHIVNDKGIYHSDLILNEMNKDIRKALKQEEGNNRDGMDVTLCVIDKSVKTMEFSGAMNPLYYIRNNELNIIKGDKCSIGGQQSGSENRFTRHVINLDTPISFYLSSDGYADQFGGPRGKKFKYNQFKELLSSIHNISFHEQKKVLDETIESWKGDLEQVDDICIVGVRIN